MDVQLFNANCEFVGIVDDYTSYSFTRSYSGIGTWQLVLDATSPNCKYLALARYIRHAPGCAGFIKKKELTKDTLTLTGVELKGLAASRIVMPPDDKAYLTYYNKSPEYIIENLLSTQICTPTDSKRKITGTVEVENEAIERLTYNGRFSNLAEDVCEIAETYNLGWHADIENGSIVWHIYNGIDRRASQNLNNRMLLDDMADKTYSEAYANVQSTTAALVAGQGEGTNRAIVRLNDSLTGVSRWEVYIDARDVADSTQLEARGLNKLAQYGEARTIEVLGAGKAFESMYRNGYDLGDTGTLLGDNIDFRLTAVVEAYEAGARTIQFQFGYDAGGLDKAIARKFGNYQNEVI